jgi:hypothetical protein
MARIILKGNSLMMMIMISKKDQGKVWRQTHRKDRRSAVAKKKDIFKTE